MNKSSSDSRVFPPYEFPVGHHLNRYAAARPALAALLRRYGAACGWRRGPRDEPPWPLFGRCDTALCWVNYRRNMAASDRYCQASLRAEAGLAGDDLRYRAGRHDPLKYARFLVFKGFVRCDQVTSVVAGGARRLGVIFNDPRQATVAERRALSKRLKAVEADLRSDQFGDPAELDWLEADALADLEAGLEALIAEAQSPRSPAGPRGRVTTRD